MNARAQAWLDAIPNEHTGFVLAWLLGAIATANSADSEAVEHAIRAASSALEQTTPGGHRHTGVENRTLPTDPEPVPESRT